MVERIGLFGALSTANRANQAEKHQEEYQEKKEKERKQLVKNSDGTFDLLTIVKGKIVFVQKMTAEQVQSKFGSNPSIAGIETPVLLFENTEMQMGTKKREDAQSRYGPQVANNFFMQI